MKTSALAVASLLFVLVCDACADAASSPLEGTWRAAEVQTVDSLGAVFFDPASLFIFTPGYYSIMRVSGQLPRAGFAAAAPTDAEKLVAYDGFVANAGTYELSGDTIVIRPQVSKHPNFMGGGTDRYQFRMAGDTLWLTGSSDNLRYMINGQLIPPSGAPVRTTFKLVRLE